MKEKEKERKRGRKRKLLKQYLCLETTPKGCLHEISFRAKWYIFISVSGQFLITVYIMQPQMKLIACIISLRSFWPKSFWVIKYHVNITKNKIIWKETSAHVLISSKQSWLHFTEWTVFLGKPPKRNFISFHPQWKSNVNIIFYLWWIGISFRVDLILGLMNTL